MHALRSHPRILSGVWVLFVLALIFGAWKDSTTPTGWEEAAAHIEATGDARDLIVVTPAFEARQIPLFEGRMAVAADGVLPREIRPWDRIWLVSTGPIPPGVAPLLRPFQRADERESQGVKWALYTRTEAPR